MFYQLMFNKNTIFHDDRKPEAATAVWRAPDNGHCNARNMLSSVSTTKQYILRFIVASSWVFYLSIQDCTQYCKYPVVYRLVKHVLQFFASK